MFALLTLVTPKKGASAQISIGKLLYYTTVYDWFADILFLVMITTIVPKIHAIESTDANTKTSPAQPQMHAPCHLVIFLEDANSLLSIAMTVMNALLILASLPLVAVTLPVTAMTTTVAPSILAAKPPV